MSIDKQNIVDLIFFLSIYHKKQCEVQNLFVEAILVTTIFFKKYFFSMDIWKRQHCKAHVILDSLISTR